MVKKSPPVKFNNLPLPAGTLLNNRYEITKRLAKGGFGMVYQARRLADGELVAIKEFLPSVLPCRLEASLSPIRFHDSNHNHRFQSGLTAFYREAETLSRLHISQVIPVWNVFEANGTGYFVMPFESGVSLHDWAFKSRPHPPVAQIVKLILSACEGVRSLHQNGLLHLDLKPGNFWVGIDHRVTVLDLGASRWGDEDGRLSQMARTPGFAAPEQHGVKSASALSIRTDIYGLAATLLACLERASLPSASLRKKADLPFATRLRGFYTPLLLGAIDHGLQLDPNLRPSSVLAWKKELFEALPGQLTWANRCSR